VRHCTSDTRNDDKPASIGEGSGEPISDLITMGLDILDSSPFDISPHTSPHVPAVRVRESVPRTDGGRRRLQAQLTRGLTVIVRHPPPFGASIATRISMALQRDLPKRGGSCTTVVIAGSLIVQGLVSTSEA